MDFDQSLRHGAQSRMIPCQLRHPAGEALRCCRPYLQAEPTQDAPETHLDIVEFRLNELAGCQKGAYLLRSRRFAMHRLEPAETQELGNATRILTICLHGHGFESIPHMAGFKKLDAEAF